MRQHTVCNPISRLETLLVCSPVIGPSVDEVLEEMLAKRESVCSQPEAEASPAKVGVAYSLLMCKGSHAVGTGPIGPGICRVASLNDSSASWSSRHDFKLQGCNSSEAPTEWEDEGHINQR